MPTKKPKIKKKLGRPPIPRTAEQAGPFAVALREMRERAGLSQDELGAKAGLCDRTLAYIEAGREPHLYTAAKLAEVLGGDLAAMCRPIPSIPKRGPKKFREAPGIPE